MAALVAPIVVWGPAAAAAAPRAAGAPFETVVVPPERPRHALVAYTLMGAGLGAIAASFPIAHAADREYTRYLAASDPGEIDRRFDRTRRLDRWSSGALIGGEVLLAAGVYLRFLRHPSPHAALVVGPSQCVVSYRF